VQRPSRLQRKALSLLFPAGMTKKVKSWSPKSAKMVRKRSSSAPMCAAKNDVRSLIDKALERFGRLHVAVNMPGTEGVPGPVTEQTVDTYAATFDTNVLGTLLSMKHELPVMLPQKRGSIVNISSTFGHTGAPGASVYSASKPAVEGLTKSAALEAAGTGVRVNAIAPGPIETPTLNRFAKTEERKAGMVSNVPLKVWEDPKRLLRPSFLFPPTKPLSSRELPTLSTGASRPEVDACRQPVSEEEAEEIITEAMRSVRPGYRPHR
jgi:NAD(P)-dependent dehydrogenase (short-subunit alcohol dehydrogenase family)